MCFIYNVQKIGKTLLYTYYQYFRDFLNMLTPRFKLSQDENYVYIDIHAPFTNITDTEIDVDGENFLFISSPYFLRLRLPGKITENEKAKGSYVCESGDFKLIFSKATSGEYFENLDMITSLLAPRDIPNLNPNLIEVLEEDGVMVEENTESKEDLDRKKFAYGFAQKIITNFCDIGNEFPQIFELKVPEEVSAGERHVLREKYEKKKFSSDHYLADYFERELIEPYLLVKLYWQYPDFNKDADFTSEEIGLLKELPNKNYLISKEEHKQILLGLVDILFGYCYDKRSTLNESTVESSWTINKLSSTLSWFCVFQDIKHVLVACYRRALIFPIFRNFDLCTQVHKDLVSLLKHGKKFIVKCIIDIYKMFNKSNDARYILNQLYVQDYLIYIQKLDSNELHELCNNIANVVIKKTDLNLELEELEYAAELVQKEEGDVMENMVAVKMASMSLIADTKKNVSQLNNRISSSSDCATSDSSSDDFSSEIDSDDD